MDGYCALILSSRSFVVIKGMMVTPDASTPYSTMLIPLRSFQVGYDPKRSRVSDDKLAEFIRSAITGKVTEVRHLASLPS